MPPLYELPLGFDLNKWLEAHGSEAMQPAVNQAYSNSVMKEFSKLRFYVISLSTYSGEELERLNAVGILSMLWCKGLWLLKQYWKLVIDRSYV